MAKHTRTYRLIKSINNKQHYKFNIFDVQEIYPSISKELLTDVLNFAETIIKFDDHDEKIIYHSHKSLVITFQSRTNKYEKRR